jgi:hypothetical protein
VEPWGGSGGAATALGAVAVLAAVLVALTAAVAFLAAWVASGPPRGMSAGKRPTTVPEQRTALVSVALVTLAVLGTVRAARPADASVALHFEPATPEGDRLFGTLLPRWNDARAAVDLPQRTGADPGDATAAAAALISTGRGLSEGLGSALEALASGSARRDLGERRWYALVERVNEASWQSGFPYYVDPTEVVQADGDAPRRWYRVDAYGVDEVRRFASRGRNLATLHVRALTLARTPHASLGLERDVQPFAVVVLDEIRAYRDELEQLAAQAPPRCATGPPRGPAAEEALRACGEVLARLSREGDLGSALLAATDRHELQHRIDGPHFSGSGWLERRLAFRPREVRARIQRELSAYLAQMTAPDPAPRLTLVRLVRMALLVRRGVEHEAALLAFEVLEGQAQEMGEEEAAEAYRALAGVGDAALAAKAERAWRASYGGSLARVDAR